MTAKRKKKKTWRFRKKETRSEREKRQVAEEFFVLRATVVSLHARLSKHTFRYMPNESKFDSSDRHSLSIQLLFDSVTDPKPQKKKKNN